jgi:hypothetical protein
MELLILLGLLILLVLLVTIIVIIVIMLDDIAGTLAPQDGARSGRGF